MPFMTLGQEMRWAYSTMLRELWQPSSNATYSNDKLQCKVRHYHRSLQCRDVETWVCCNKWDRHAAALTTDASTASVCLCTSCSTPCHTCDSDAMNTQRSSHPDHSAHSWQNNTTSFFDPSAVDVTAVSTHYTSDTVVCLNHLLNWTK